MKKRLLAILIACVFMFGFTFSPNLFTHVSESQQGSAVGANAATEVSVTSLAQLVSNGQDSATGSTANVATDRTTLRLDADVTLTGDVTLTRNIGLDLNGRTLNLGNHTLMLRHAYSGSIPITNGTIITGGNSGGIVLNVPNADYQVSNVSFLDAPAGNALSASKVINASSTLPQLAQAYFTDAVMSGGLNGAYYGNVVFPVSYGDKGTYRVSSNKPQVLSATGVVSASASTDEVVTLSVDFTSQSGNTFSFTVQPRVVGSENDSAWLTLIGTHLKEILSAEDSSDGTHLYQAKPSNSIYLPVSGGWNGSLSYTTSGGTYVSGNSSYAFLDVGAVRTAGVSTTLTVSYRGASFAVLITPSSGEVVTDVTMPIIRELFGETTTTTVEFVKTNGVFNSYSLAMTSALSDLGLESLSARLVNNYGGSYSVANERLSVLSEPEVGEEVLLDLTLTISGTEYLKRLNLHYANTTTDSQPNPARFLTHFAYFEQFFRNGTYGRYEMDSSVALKATKNDSIPYVAYRVTDTAGNVYSTDIANGGILLQFQGSDGEIYNPVYNANGVFSGLTLDMVGATPLTLEQSMAKFVRTESASAEPLWLLQITPASLNKKDDQNLLLEYQYSFARDYSDTTKTYWYTYTADELGVGAKITSAFALLGLTMCGAGDEYDFDNQLLYDALINHLAPGARYLARRKLSQDMNRLDVKALLYPDKNPNDGIDNGDVTNALENDSVAALGIANFSWLRYLTGVKYLNLHGMRITDDVISTYIVNLTQLTGLDVSGVYDASYAASGHGYNENNSYYTPVSYSGRSANVTSTGLDKICRNLIRLETLDVSYCRIATFSSLVYLGDGIKTIYIEGNTTGGGSGTANSDGSTGAAQVFYLGVFAVRCSVYNTIAGRTAGTTVSALPEAYAIYQSMSSIVYPSVVPAGTTMAEIQATLPPASPSSFFWTNGTIGGLTYYNAQYSYVVGENEIGLQLKAESWSSGSIVVYYMRMPITFV